MNKLNCLILKRIMKKNLTALFFLSCSLVYAQPVFQRTYGGLLDDYATCAHQTPDGGYIITGSSWFGMGLSRISLIKTDAQGDTLWTKAFGAPETAGGIESVEPTADGGYIIASGTSAIGLKSVFLIKTNEAGDVQWAKTVGGTNDYMGNSIVQLSDGGFAIAGYTKSYGAGNLPDIYFLKTDADGNVLLNKTYGGIGFDRGECVRQTSDGGFIIAGRTTSFGVGDSDALLIKIDLLGNIVWAKTYGGTGYDDCYYVLQTGSGFISAGRTQSFGAGLNDVFVFATDQAGNLLWSRTYGGVGDDISTWIQAASNGSYIVAGYTNSFGNGLFDCCILNINDSGDLNWARTFGGEENDYGCSAKQTDDDGFIVSGHTKSYGAGSDDIFLIKTNEGGHTGCDNQNSPNPMTGSPATIVNNAVPQISSPVVSSTPVFPIVASGAMVSNPCVLTGSPESYINPGVLISPNPFSGNTKIRLTKNIFNATLIIYNAPGQIVYSREHVCGADIVLRLPDIPDGIYQMRITDGNRVVVSDKLLIRGR